MLTAENQKLRVQRRTEIGDSVFIYGLVCPIEGIVRYVGQTNKPYSRLFAHIRSSKNPGMREWLDRLLVDGRIPQVLTLEITSHSLANKREKVWVRYYYSRHADRLLNIARLPVQPVWLKGPSRGGRPPIGDVAMNSTLLIQCMKDQKSEWKRSAKLAGKSLGQWIRDTLDNNS